MHLQLSPLDADPVNIGIDNGVSVWAASTFDPAFVARAAEGNARIGPGWCRATVILDGRSGEIRQPRLYLPDMAGHFSETRTVELTRQGVAYKAEFFLPTPVNHLRFDPSTTRCEFACAGLEISPISRLRGAVVSLRDSSARVASSLFGLARSAWQPRRSSPPTNFPKGVRAELHDREHLRIHIDTEIASARPLGRKARVLRGIDRAGVGLEIGPSHDPLAPKSEGYKVHVIDHTSREGLLVKYRPHNVPLDRIEEVDFVWRGQTYLELTGNPKYYDWIIASHLIEHTPDLIAFLADCDAILKDTGVLSLVIPDKRYIFDRFRPITGLARIIDAHIAGHKIHTVGATAEYFMNVVTKAGHGSWDARTNGEYDFLHSAQLARDMTREVRERGSYLDVHNWCFVPHSFRLLMADLYALGYTKLREVDFHSVEGHEFYVTLGRHGAGPPLSRLEMLSAIDAELAAADAPAR